jgi:hypothetical protein
MRNVFPGFPEFIRLGAFALGLTIQIHAFAGGEPTPISTDATLPALPANIAELKFRDFFVLPLGDGEPKFTQQLHGLDGRRVRIVGYMARQEAPGPGVFLLTPMPMTLATAADDLPAATLFVHLPSALEGQTATHAAGLIALTGTLSVGTKHEADGRISRVRLQLDLAPAAQPQSA